VAAKPAPTAAAPAGPNARSVARRLLVAVFERRMSLDDALDADGPAAALAPRDRGFAHLLAATVLRRQGTIDAVLNRCMSRPLPEGAVSARTVLRLGAAQLLFLGTPGHAAVATSVDEVKRMRGGVPFAPLVNAVLRRIERDGEVLMAGLDPLALDTPEPLRTAWIEAYGEETARAIAEAHAAQPPLDLTVKSDPQAWAGRLGGIVMPGGSVRVPATTRVPDLPGFSEGGFWVQDLAASWPARLLGARRGETALDLCAAPGGKTAQLALGGALVTAVELSPARAGRLRENLARLQVEARVLEADATFFQADPLFDAVLLDAPCSATGTIRRHPDIAHLKAGADLRSILGLQDRLLDTAAAALKPGGRLVYAVCSLDPREGQERVEALLARTPTLLRAPFTEAELALLPEARTPEGWFRTLPCFRSALGGMDGFFAARLTLAGP